MRGGVKNKKNVVKLVILTWVSICGVVGAGMAARWFGGITQSEETNEIFNAAAQLPPDLLESVVWEPDRSDLRRKMEPLSRVDITSAWLRAWEQLSIVAKTGDTTGLEVYFSNSALEALLASVEDTNGRPVRQISHRLRVDFYSQDGQVVGITAPEIQLVRSVPVGDDLGWIQTTEAYEVVMLLEDGNFRIQHWVRRDLEERWWTEPVAPATAIEEGSARLPVNGINYYPRDTPFADFWSSYDPAVIDADLDRIAALGMDSVRIFINFDEFLGRWTTEEELAPVLDFMTRADDRGLGVVVTLFDGRTDHRTDKWDSDRAHVEAVVPILAEHPALVMWDIKNEPDRDIGANGVGEQLMYAWLTHIAHEVRDEDPVTPLTVGWSTAEAALAAPIVTDVVSFHHYGPAADLDVLGPALDEYAEDRPVLLTEYGLPTWDSIFPGGHTEAEQEVYVADVLRRLDSAGIDGTMIWTLWDLAAAPPDAGSFPWASGPQVNLGLLRADGTEKPVAALLGPDPDLDGVEPLGPTHRLSKRFWRLAMIGAFAMFVLWYIGGRAKKARAHRRSRPRRRDKPASDAESPTPSASKAPSEAPGEPPRQTVGVGSGES